MKALLFGTAVGLLSAMGVAAPQQAFAQSLACTMNPPNPIGTGTPTAPCNGSAIASVSYDAHFVIVGLTGGPYTYAWTATVNQGNAQPPLSTPCTTSCDQTINTNSVGPSVVKVVVNVTNTSTGVVTTMQTTARAPCVTFKTNNHPTLC